MAKITLTANDTPSTAIHHRAGLALVVAKGTIGGGTISLQYQTPEMEASSDWITVSETVSGSVAPLAITTADRPVCLPLPSCNIRASITGASSPNLRLYVDGA